MNYLHRNDSRVLIGKVTDCVSNNIIELAVLLSGIPRPHTIGNTHLYYGYVIALCIAF